ncbi:uncharacterized protein LOC114359323 [Ostrinia furnacalis]|uniref:uncharacterized protein LOC114359323 n=1 Tax=Ostrinia furnacalis TaxID=93504 RepID=UPI00103977AF|nr:uncharacterized protein LOC114359323 [Ostrinia furnacalis]
MSKLKEITGYNMQKKQVMRFVNIDQLNLPPMDQLYELCFVDHNGKPYVFRRLKPEVADDNLDKLNCESLSIDLNDIKEIFIKLTDDQRNIVMHVYYMYRNNKKFTYENDSGEVCEENPKIILQGPAGTGKSTIINFIEKLITWEENKTSDAPNNLKVIKCAFTGKAASNIEGFTLNYTFSIPIYKTTRLSKKRIESKKELFKDCIFFICDEISMVGERTMSAVNLRLQQIFDNDKLYGDRFVLLVGDLYQIDPVRQRPVYPQSKLWTCCEFYELTKIIRQQDEKFITALNNFRDSKMTEEDINLLRSREIEDYDQVPESVIHIFYQNKYVDEYNNLKLNKSTEKEEIVNAVEDSENWNPSHLRVKIGIRYMITNNIDVGDGLANGTTGIVKDFDYDKDGVSAIWMEFHSSQIGKKLRSDYLKMHNKSGFDNWVPIPRSKIVVKLISDPKVSKTVGNMFPLKAAEAITVHKSQGQTYHEGVCIHIQEDAYDKLRTDKSLQYVALTRVKRLEDLYIMGKLNFSLMNSAKFNRTEQEINRLRNEKKLKLAYETFEDNNGDVIIYLNTGLTFNEHYQFVTTDKWYDNASLLIFSETNTIGSDIIEIPNFEIAFRSDNDTALRSGGGIICYKKDNKLIDVISSMLDDENKMYLTLFLYENSIYIVTGVKGDLSDDDFIEAVKNFILKYVRNEKCIFLVGNIIMSPSLINFFNQFNINTELSCSISNEEPNDVVLSRNIKINGDQMGFYQYIPAPHQPIFVKLPPKCELSESHGNSQSYYSQSQTSTDESRSVISESQDSQGTYSENQSENSQTSSSQPWSQPMEMDNF